MAFFRPNITEQSPRLFDNDFMEILSRTHPALVVIIYLPLSLALLWHSVARVGIDGYTSLWLALVGMVAWTLTEYWLHRIIMHWVPEFSWGPRMHFWMHGVHHDWPDDPYRLVMPPSVSIVLFFIFLGLFWMTLGPYCWAFQGGFTLGYIMYDVSHYLFHHSNPQSGWVKALQRHHLLHHFNPKYEELHFSITVPMWDKLFGTTRPAKSSGSET